MAQLDNAADSDSEERGFKSLWAGQKNDKFRQKLVVFLSNPKDWHVIAGRRM